MQIQDQHGIHSKSLPQDLEEKMSPGNSHESTTSNHTLGCLINAFLFFLFVCLIFVNKLETVKRKKQTIAQHPFANSRPVMRVLVCVMILDFCGEDGEPSARHANALPLSYISNFIHISRYINIYIFKFLFLFYFCFQTGCSM